jgi:hypothetical protein
MSKPLLHNELINNHDSSHISLLEATKANWTANCIVEEEAPKAKSHLWPNNLRYSLLEMPINLISTILEKENKQ